MTLGCAGLNWLSSTFWPITLQPVGVDWATIPHMKGDIHSYHMRHERLICSKRLHRKIKWNPLPDSPLVYAKMRLKANLPLKGREGTALLGW